MASQIVSGLDHSEMCLTYLKSIKDYVESNIQIMAIYTGVTPAGTPDPLSGPIVLKLTLTPTMVEGAKVKAFLSSLKEPNPSAFIQAIFSELVSDIIQGPATHTLTATAIYTINNFNESEIDNLKKSDNYVDCWNIVCAPIVRTFKTIIAVPAAIPTTTASGVGTTVINKVL